MPDTLNRMLRRLTDNYAKQSDSNVARLLTLAADEIDDVDAALQTVQLYRSVDEASGHTLDRIGYNLQQYRGQASDSQYRVLIKTRIARNLSDGTVDHIKRTLALAVKTDPEEITVTEQWPDEPAAIHVDLPGEAVAEAGMSLTQFGRLTNYVVAAGVRATVLMQGTFQFSSDYDSVNMDAEKGFADLDQTMGGYFGAVYDPADDPDLPI